MDLQQFESLMQELSGAVAGRALTSELAGHLNAQHGPGSELFQRVREACLQGREEGWLCARQAAGIHYGRACKPSPALHGFSVDVVDMRDVVGPHHVHPLGEVDLVMPLEGDARFDGAPAGWVVYPPGSAHRPTVSHGRALVLYLLPEGRIEFTGQ
jgi:hypothetical protein